MKISDLKIDVIELELPSIAVTDSGTIGGKHRKGVLRIIAEDGTEGNCFIAEYWGRGEPHFEPILGLIKPLLVGRDIASQEWLWAQLQRLYTRFKLTDQAWAPVDIALWDLMGKHCNQPVYKILGAARESVPAYATFPARHKSAEGFDDEALEVVNSNFRAYKMHPGGVDTKTAKSAVEAARQAVGDDITLMFDPNCGYDYQKALAVGEVLDANDYHWFEDPFPGHDLDAILALSHRLKTPLCMCDQGDRQFFQAAQLVRNQAVRMIRGSSYKLGMTGLKKQAALAEAYGLQCEIGTAGNAIFNMANLHAILAMHNCSFYEFMLPSSLDRFGLETYVDIDENGLVQAPTGPGLGVKLDWDWINHHKIASLE